MKKKVLIALSLLMIVAISMMGLVACNGNGDDAETEYPIITFSGLTELTFYTNQTITAANLTEGVTAKDANGVSYTVSTYDTTALKAEEGTYVITLACRDENNVLVRKNLTEIWIAERTIHMEYPPIQDVDRANWSTSLKLISISFPQAAGNVQTGIFTSPGTNLNDPSEEEAATELLNLRDHVDETVDGQKIIIAENWLASDAILTAGERWYITTENLSNWSYLVNNRDKVKASEMMIAVQGKGAGWSAIIINSSEIIRYGEVSGESEEIYTIKIRVPYQGNDMSVDAVFEICDDDSSVPFVNYAENLRLAEGEEVMYTAQTVNALNTAIDNCAAATARAAYKPLFDIAYDALIDLERRFENKALELLEDLDEEDYSTVTWQAFVAAVDAAAAELGDETQYDTLYQLAVAAKDALNPKIDTSSASALLSDVTQGDYTTESWLSFKQAVDAAVAEDDNQAEFDSLLALAVTAKGNLVSKDTLTEAVKLKSMEIYGETAFVTHAGMPTSNLVESVGEGNGEQGTAYNQLYAFIQYAENPVQLTENLNFEMAAGDIWYLQMLSVGGGYVLGGGTEGTKVAGSVDDGSLLNAVIPIGEGSAAKNMLRISYTDVQNYAVKEGDDYVITVYYTASGLFLYVDLVFELAAPTVEDMTFIGSDWGGSLSSNPAIQSSFLYKYVGDGAGDVATDYVAVAYYNYTQEAVEGIKTADKLNDAIFGAGDTFYIQFESLSGGFSFLDGEGNIVSPMTGLPQLQVVGYDPEKTLIAVTKNCFEITFEDLTTYGMLNQDETAMVLNIRVAYAGLNADISLYFEI
ncbi:MAG: hypothetical protein WC292_00735 [Clostridia bacterium]